MNERKFLKQINSKNNKDGFFTCSIVLDLIDSEIENLDLQKTSKNSNILRRLFSRFNVEKSAVQIIEDNFPKILEKTKSTSVELLILRLIEGLETEHIVIDNLDIILNRLIKDDVFKECSKDVFYEIIGLPEGTDFIVKNIDNILENVFPSNIFKFSQYLKGLSEETDEKINETLENNKIEVAKSLLEDCIITRIGLDYNEELVNEYKLTLSVMIDELLESEKCRYIDINYLSRGAYSNVYQIGDKVIKIGGPRQTYFIPNHRRILQPLIRTNFIDKNNKAFACVEISDKVDPLLKEDITEKKLYEIYKDLIEDGIIWTDIRFPNVGRLNKNNVPSLNGEKMNVAPNSLGFINDKSERDLYEGDLVIIDTDFIYNKGDKNIKYNKLDLLHKFEMWYQQEKSAEIAKKYNSGELHTEKTIQEEQR